MSGTEESAGTPAVDPDHEDHSLTNTAAAQLDVGTVEAFVRHQLAASLGGKRGMLEAAIPGVIFSGIWLPTKDLHLALIASLAVAGAALVARVIQKSPTQYVFNAIFGIGIGWVFVRWAESSGGSESDKALAFFLPGILISLAYTVVMSASCLVGWPVLGFMLGAATEDPVGWHKNEQVVKLCSRLTWVMLLPGAIGVIGQGPVWLLGHAGTIDADVAVVVILVLRTGLGWALRIGSWALMIWLLARNATPLEPEPGAG
ncbi:DUF3159 domain-containing protein [Nocardioides sp. MH1]|uniref:DUF3159 domain-containing protein n=1 Tax=Nocardioides sp. MH1 TaxID=3242490 RepID=UPI003522299B